MTGKKLIEVFDCNEESHLINIDDVAYIRALPAEDGKRRVETTQIILSVLNDKKEQVIIESPRSFDEVKGQLKDFIKE